MRRWRADCPLLLAAALIVPLARAFAAGAATNLLVNGSFDAPGEPLKGWNRDYAWTDNSWYKDNKKRVSVIPRDGSRTNVLKLSATRQILWGDGQGVKADSQPVPFEQGATYKLTASARSQADGSNPGPNCRIYIEGYGWKPGVKPHGDPDLSELRKVYKQGSGNLLYFGGSDSGPFSNVSSTWQKGSCTFPGDKLSEAGQEHLKKVKFIVVHIVAIDGWDGALLVDDVALERVK